MASHRSESKRTNVVLLAGAVIIVGAAAGGLFMMLFGGSSPSTDSAFNWSTLRMPASRPVGGVAGAGSVGMVREASDFDKLVDLFRKEKDNPAAQKFAREFRAEPELQKAWDEFVADQQGAHPQETVQQLGQALAGNASFRQLVARYSQDPGFREAALKFSDVPAVHEAMRAVLEQASATRSASAVHGGRAFLAALRGGAGAGSGQGIAAHGAVGTRVGAAEAYGATAHAAGTVASAGVTAGTPAAGPGQGSYGAPQTAGGPSMGKDSKSTPGPHQQQQAQSQGDSYNVNPQLDGNWAGQGASNPMSTFYQDFPWLAQLTPDELNLIQAGVRKGYGVWGACFASQLFAQCHDACLQDPTRTGGCVGGWNACQQMQHPFKSTWPSPDPTTDAKCIQGCRDQQPCTPPNKPKMTCLYCRPKADPVPPDAPKTMPDGTTLSADGTYFSLDHRPEPVPECGTGPKAWTCGMEPGTDPECRDEHDDPRKAKRYARLMLNDFQKIDPLLPRAVKIVQEKDVCKMYRDASVDFGKLALEKGYDAKTPNGGNPRTYLGCLLDALKQHKSRAQAESDCYNKTSGARAP